MELPIPDKIRIGPYDVEIQIGEETLTAPASGEALPYYNLIKLDGSRTIPMIQETYIHEILEMLNHHMEIKLEHSQISNLSYGLAQVIRDLPNGH